MMMIMETEERIELAKQKKSMNSLTEMCLSSETVSIKRSFRDFGSN